MNKPKVNSDSQKQLDRAQEQFDAFDKSVKDMTLDRMNTAPVSETEPQTKLSNREAEKYDAPYIKPSRSINSKEPFNEKFRDEWKRAWEYVKCIAENNEIIGERIELWTKRFPGDPAHQWKIPVNKPVYIPRHVADRLANCRYHRLVMQDAPTSSEGGMTFYGAITVDQVKNRLDCKPVGGGFLSMAS